MPTPQSLARQIIDQKLTAAGWIVQDFKALNLGAGAGGAVREFQTASGSSTAGKSGPPLRADYVLFVDRKVVGVVEAKSEGTTLRGVFEQSARYMANFPEAIPHVELPLPFSYESTGTETLFVDLRDPDYRSRRVSVAEEIEKELDQALAHVERLRRRPVPRTPKVPAGGSGAGC